MSSLTLRGFDKLIAPIKRRLAMMVGRGVLTLVDDAALLQTIQAGLLNDEVSDVMERWQQYGFTSHPHDGAECVVVFPGGNRAHGLVIAVDDRRYRLKGLAGGEVAMYDDLGQKIVLHRDRIEVTAPKVVINSENINLGGEGGAKVARIGDRVNVGSGSSAGLWPIQEGSDVVSAT